MSSPREPSEAGRLGARSRSGVDGLCRIRRGERYGACGDEIWGRGLRPLPLVIFVEVTR